ncbi:hypothetical protein ACFL2Z_02710 [Candidatus Eisenbacteria bacterium]|uniref:Uncharacterized protein n=1 Tax=Eiseniibacteriota bacterium TaxID=2212470 RepID=A0ABV6YP00_UNCEI
MNYMIPVLALMIVLGTLLPCMALDGATKQPIVFATFAEDAGSLKNVLLMAESIRTFGGRYKDAPIWVYMPPDLAEQEVETIGSLEALGVEARTSEALEDALGFYYAQKVFASVRAEGHARDFAEVLAWLDEDTIMLQEPAEFMLPEDKALGYRPVMHKNIGNLFTEPVDEFWGRVFELLAVPDSTFFPMVTPADGDTLRPYFNAGCMVVRPRRGILSRWLRCFIRLYRDPVLVEMCNSDIKRRIFMHQAALTGAILTRLDRDEMLEFSPRINYPIFFEQMFGAKRTFDDITDVVTFRHESYFRKPAPDWDKKLKGSEDRIAWMKEHLIAADGK